MAIKTEISWCDHTANLWWGCVEVAPECDNCYAREWAKRYDRAKWGSHEPRLAVKGVWKDLGKMQRDAAAAGSVRSVFVGSMMDIGEKEQPVVDNDGHPMAMMTSALRQQLFAMIENGRFPNLLFLLLSKRPQNYPAIVPYAWRGRMPRNVYFGATAGTQKSMDANAAALLRMQDLDAAGIFLSCEPLLERVIVPEAFLGPNFSQDDPRFTYRWVIAGGESGRKARPSHPAWFRSLRDQCAMFGTPFHFKQWGEWAGADIEEPEDDDGVEGWFSSASRDGIPAPLGRMHDWLDGQALSFRISKLASGRQLDGVTYDDVPTADRKPLMVEPVIA